MAFLVELITLTIVGNDPLRNVASLACDKPTVLSVEKGPLIPMLDTLKYMVHMNITCSYDIQYLARLPLCNIKVNLLTSREYILIDSAVNTVG